MYAVQPLCVLLLFTPQGNVEVVGGYLTPEDVDTILISKEAGIHDFVLPVFEKKEDAISVLAGISV